MTGRLSSCTEKTAAFRLARIRRPRLFPIEGKNNVVQWRRVGEDHPRADLTSHEVDLVRELHDGGMGYRAIARKFEVSKACVRDIIKGRRRLYG